MTAPIFIVGANRSGTTLLRLMLNAHSRVGIPEELVYFNSTLAGIPVEQWRNPDLSASAYWAFVSEVLDANPTVLENLDRDALEAELLRDDAADLRRPYAGLLNAWAEAQDKPRWGEKTPGNLFFVDVLLEMFPDAQFIHVVRDPRAGVASMQAVDFFPKNVFFNAMSREKNHRVATRFRREVSPAQWTTIRYEDLVADPEVVLRRLCPFLGEAFEPAMLEYHRSSATYMKDEAASSFNAAATGPVTTKMTDKWKRQLSDRDVAIIETVCRDEMDHFEYPTSGRRLSLTTRATLWMHMGYWALQQWRNRDVREYTVKSPMFARSRSRIRHWVRPRFPTLAARIGP